MTQTFKPGRFSQVLSSTMQNHRVRNADDSMYTGACTTASEVFFKIQIYIFLNTLTLQIYFLILKINTFRGDLSDVSAKTATLTTTLRRRMRCCIAVLYDSEVL